MYANISVMTLYNYLYYNYQKTPSPPLLVCTIHYTLYKQLFSNSIFFISSKKLTAVWTVVQ